MARAAQTVHKQMTTAETAIKRSISHHEIVTLDYDSDAMADLAAECEDHVTANEVEQYWGTTDDGDEWRVHVRHEERRAAGYYAVDTGDGNELCNGLAPEIARKAAQAHADRLGESVYLYEVGSDEEAEEIAPERSMDAWWAWHDADADRWSGGEGDAATADAERRCAAWVAGESDDGPEGK